MKKLQRGMGTRTERYLEEHKPPKASPSVKLILGIASVSSGLLFLGVTLAFPSEFQITQSIIAGIWFFSGLMILLKHSEYKRKFNEELKLANPIMQDGETIGRSSFLIGQSKIQRKKTENENFKTIIMLLIAFYLTGITVGAMSYLDIGLFILIFPSVGLIIIGASFPFIFHQLRIEKPGLFKDLHFLIFLLIPVFAYMFYEITESLTFTLLIGFGTVVLIILLMIVNKKQVRRISIMKRINSKDKNESKNGQA